MREGGSKYHYNWVLIVFFNWYADDGQTLDAGFDTNWLFQGIPYIHVIFQGGIQPLVTTSGSVHNQTLAEWFGVTLW